MSNHLDLSIFVPHGTYCYKSLGVEVIDNTKPFDGGFIYHIKPCIFYLHKKESCWLMGGEDILDQCKICGINEGMNEGE